MLMYDDGYFCMGPRGRFYPYCIMRLMLGQVMYLGRALRTKETLPDFR